MRIEVLRPLLDAQSRWGNKPLRSSQFVGSHYLHLHGHPSGANECSAHFGKIASDVGLLYFGQCAIEVVCFDERRLGLLRDGMLQDKVPDVAQQTFDEQAATRSSD